MLRIQTDDTILLRARDNINFFNTDEDDLRKRQEEHLKKVRKFRWNEDSMERCAHNACSSCVGTGIKIDGYSLCSLWISCTCRRCNPHTL